MFVRIHDRRWERLGGRKGGEQYRTAARTIIFLMTYGAVGLYDKPKFDQEWVPSQNGSMQSNQESEYWRNRFTAWL
jgi:hypothetical protein